MRYLALAEVIELHRMVIEQTGGSHGVRDLGLPESAIAQPKTSSGGADLYETLVDKAAALCSSLVQNHPFVDGNKRVGHAAMETFLTLIGWEIDASVDEQERLILNVAAGEWRRPALTAWLQGHVVPFDRNRG